MMTVRTRRVFAPLGTVLLAAMAMALPAPAAAPKTWIVCPAGATAKDCAFKGNQAIQAAVDRATDGDTVRIRAGTYAIEKPRDVKFEDYVIRAYVVVDGKALHLVGEQGAVIDGKDGPASTAMLIKGSDVTLRNLSFRNLHVASDEDDIYDGHGVFIMNSTAAVSGLALDHFEKMGLSARGTSNVTATDLRIVGGHVGIWVRETAQLRLCNSVIRGNHGVGVGGAAHASIQVYNSVMQANELDGVYLKEDASALVTNSIISGNKPGGVSAKNNAQAWVSHSVLFANEKGATSATDAGIVKLGPGISEVDPQLTWDFRLTPAVASRVAANPDVLDRAGARAPVGLSDVAGCLRSQGI
jgi:hypothetical protein